MSREERVKKSAELYTKIIELVEGNEVFICLEALAGAVASVVCTPKHNFDDESKCYAIFHKDVLELINKFRKNKAYTRETH